MLIEHMYIDERIRDLVCRHGLVISGDGITKHDLATTAIARRSGMPFVSAMKEHVPLMKKQTPDDATDLPPSLECLQLYLDFVRISTVP